MKHVYVTTFRNKKDESLYGDSPQHQEHIKLGADYIESVSATDYFLKELVTAENKSTLGSRNGGVA